MQMIYNSDNYCVVEFGADGQHAMLSAGGYEKSSSAASLPSISARM
jgi:hypothetical protein